MAAGEALKRGLQVMVVAGDQSLRNCSISASSAPSAGARDTPVTSICGFWPHSMAGAGWLAGRSPGRGGLLCAGAGEPVGVGAGFEDVAAEGEPVDDRGAEPGVSEGFGPAAEGFVGGDRDVVAFLAFGEDLEQQFGAAFVEAAPAFLGLAVLDAADVDGLDADPLAGRGIPIRSPAWVPVTAHRSKPLRACPCGRRTFRDQGDPGLLVQATRRLHGPAGGPRRAGISGDRCVTRLR